MKLAKALSDRADLQRRLSELETRLNNNAKVQEGQSPSEDPEELLSELDRVLCALETLVAKINLANSRTMTADGVTMTELLARRDMLSKRCRIMRGFLDNASGKVDRYSRAEIAVLSTVNVAALQKEVDRVSKSLRETDEAIQELNWTTEIEE